MTEDLPSYVVDASIALKWTIRTDEPFLEQADMLLLDYQNGLVQLMGPIHLPSEVAHGLVRAVRRGRISRDDAHDQLHLFLSLRIPIFGQGDLFHEAVDLAESLGCSFYDASYVALAKRRGIYLVHADEALQAKMTDAIFALHRWIGDYRSGLT
jgi:predicted nucleic acid-binding protein